MKDENMKQRTTIEGDFPVAEGYSSSDVGHSLGADAKGQNL